MWKWLDKYWPFEYKNSSSRLFHRDSLQVSFYRLVMHVATVQLENFRGWNFHWLTNFSLQIKFLWFIFEVIYLEVSIITLTIIIIFPYICIDLNACSSQLDTTPPFSVYWACFWGIKLSYKTINSSCQSHMTTAC